MKSLHEKQMREMHDMCASHLKRMQVIEEQTIVFNQGLMVDG